MPYFNDLLRPKELCEKYKTETEFLNWTSVKLGTFLSSHLLRGMQKTSRRPALISEKSFIKLLDFVKKVSKTKLNLIFERKEPFDLYTPQELYDTVPRVQCFEWDSARIGMFFNSHLMVGIDKGISPSLITYKSFEVLIEFANENLKSMIIRPEKYRA